MNMMDYIRNTLNPNAPKNGEMLEEGKEKKVAVPKEVIDFKPHDDEITRAYKAMKNEDEGHATVSGLGAKVAKQDPVKLGGVTKVDLSPNTEPMTAKDSKPVDPKKKKEEEEVKSEEHLDEVTPKLARSYFNKANDKEFQLTQKYNSPLYGGKGPIKDKGEKEKVLRKIMNRRAGIDRAYKKMTKEENLVEISGLARVLARKVGHAAAHTVAQGLGISTDTVKDVAMAAVGRQKIVKYRYKLDKKGTNTIPTNLKQGQTPPKTSTVQKVTNKVNRITHMKPTTHHAHQPVGQAAPAPTKPAGQSPVATKAATKPVAKASVTARLGQNAYSSAKVTMKGTKPRIRVKAATSATSHQPVAKPATATSKPSDDGGISTKVDRKEFARKLKVAGGNLKKVKLEAYNPGRDTIKKFRAMTADQHLDAAIHHHNTAMDSEEKSTKNLHLTARNRHYHQYVTKADIKHLKGIDPKKLQAILDIKETFDLNDEALNSLDKIRKVLQKRNIEKKMAKWQLSQKQAHQQDVPKKD